MQRSDLEKRMKAQPFTPISISLTDGRSVLIRHPDQTVITQRTLFVGLATIGRSGPLATPKTSKAVARDWIHIDLLHISSIEPANENARRPKPKPRRKRG